MSETGEPDLSTGKGLRQTLESTLAENRELKELLATKTAAEVISARRLVAVTPEDLKGVPLAEIEAKAIELESSKLEAARSTIRKAYEAQGLSGEELDAAVDQAFAGRGGSDHAEARRFYANTASVGGVPLSDRVDTSQMSPDEKIRAGLSKPKTKSR